MGRSTNSYTQLTEYPKYALNIQLRHATNNGELGLYGNIYVAVQYVDELGRPRSITEYIPRGAYAYNDHNVYVKQDSTIVYSMTAYNVGLDSWKVTYGMRNQELGVGSATLLSGSHAAVGGTMDCYGRIDQTNPDGYYVRYFAGVNFQ